MKRYAKTIGIGLALGLLILGVYELAGGDATIVVLLILLGAHVKVRLDELRDTLEAMRAAEPTETCGDTTADLIGGGHQCALAAGHRSAWHSDEHHPHPMRWRHHP